eukprot:scaffold991_cov227-Pinguiococcus_pyrenoidosus.AAC.14
MSNFLGFGQPKKTPRETARETKRDLKRNEREVQREVRYRKGSVGGVAASHRPWRPQVQALERQERQLISEIKAEAKKGNTRGSKILAKQLVQLRNTKDRLLVAKVRFPPGKGPQKRKGPIFNPFACTRRHT